MKKIILAIAALISTSFPVNAGELRSPVAINNEVNGRISYTSDGAVDNWQMPVDEGDCEDFALLKRKELMLAGWSPTDIQLILVVRQRDLKRSGVIDFAHVVVYVKSVDLILDISPEFQGLNGNNRTTYSFAKYMETMRYAPVCVIKDVSYGIKSTATERCGKYF